MSANTRGARSQLARSLHLVAGFSVAACILSAAGAGAQETPVVGPGSRVRITAPALGLRDVVATVQDTTHDGLVVQRGRWVRSWAGWSASSRDSRAATTLPA